MSASGHAQNAGVDDSAEQHAPRLQIPARAISVVEHPCIVKNVDKGIASLGGPVKLSKGLRSSLETTTNAEGDDQLKKLISVSLRPDDPFAKRLLSTPVRTSNLLLKVTVPKRTGRKRKRGSSGPFILDDEASRNSHPDSTSNTNPYVKATTVFRSLQDNPTAYKASVVGVLDETHRFRQMPDLQYAASYDETMVGLRDHILPKKYSQLRTYNLDTAAGANLSKGIGPSAEFLQMPVAFNYRYQQNSYVKYTDEGVVNLQKSIAYRAYTIVKPTDDEVPQGPKSNLPPEEVLTPYLQTLISQIRHELSQRPIITRHILFNKLGWDKRTKLRQAAVYCGYFFESGPWREALIQWGVDPRTDPEYRKYQTVTFLSYLKSGTAEHHKVTQQDINKFTKLPPRELVNEHVFDGTSVSRTGNLFQFCDITDPLIANILATDDIRTTCAPTFQGWYHVGTWAKATVIMKHKMNTIISKKKPNDKIYRRIANWPEQWVDSEIAATYKDEVNDKQIHQEKKEEHDVMHYVRWTARNPRYAFERMEQGELPDHNVGGEAEPEVPEVPEDLAEEPMTRENLMAEDEDSQVEDNDSDQSDEGDEDDVEGSDVDAEGEWDADDDNDDDDSQPIAQTSDGPAPFGGLYRV